VKTFDTLQDVRSRHFPLRTHLLLLVVGTLLPALILAGFLLRRVAGDNRDALDRRLLETARTEAAVVDAELAGTMRALQALAESQRLATQDLVDFHEEARHLQHTQQSWSAVALFAPDGRRLLDTSRPIGTVLAPPADPDSVARVVGTRRPVVGSLQPGLDEERSLTMAVFVPVFSEERIVYVLSASITSQGLAGLLGQQTSFPDERARSVVDSKGIIAVRVPDAERFVGRTATDRLMTLAASMPAGVYRGTGLDGRRVYAAYARAPVSGWLAVVAVDESSVGAVPSQSLAVLGGIGLALLALGGGGAFLISRRIARDIAAAAVAADALASGQEPDVPRSTVTEVRRLAIALRRSASMLEAREHERDEHLARADAARNAAETADRAKDEFLATLGHELRNPLAPALTALHLMRLRGDQSGLREREIIERQVRHLARLVDDLLDVSRARSGRIVLRRHPFEIIHAIEIAIEISSPLISARGQRLTVDVPRKGFVVDGDETRLAQVFANLLNNAAKYSDRPSRITLTATASPDHIVIRCDDEGIGIGSELLPHVFDQFSQGEQSLGREYGGLGLGLAVVKTLVELHGGEVMADSAGPGRGSTFTVRLPRTVAAADAPADAEDLPPEIAGRRRILVVDDNHDAAEMLGEMLQLSGYAVTIAFDGLTALKLNEDFHADVAVLDIGLPSMDGLELGRRLRDSEAGRSIRLVAMTGYGQAGDIEASQAAGFDHHLVKPVVAEKLFDALQ
jgi:signal transduction histidine kinase